MTDMIGKVIKGKYRILDEVGQGSVATVYLAKDLESNQVIALKIIHPHLIGEGQFLERFQREARLLAKLDSPHVVQILDFGADEDEELNYIAMEFIEGHTLSTILEREGPLEMKRALEVARQVAWGLQHAHDKGIVHRDIRPANIMVTPEDRVKVMDFGVARGVDLSHLTATGILGSPQYLSPEQVEGKADIRCRHRAEAPPRTDSLAARNG
jgi:serine/threonine protein kinase